MSLKCAQGFLPVGLYFPHVTEDLLTDIMQFKEKIEAEDTGKARTLSVLIKFSFGV